MILGGKTMNIFKKIGLLCLIASCSLVTGMNSQDGFSVVLQASPDLNRFAMLWKPEANSDVKRLLYIDKNAREIKVFYLKCQKPEKISRVVFSEDPKFLYLYKRNGNICHVLLFNVEDNVVADAGAKRSLYSTAARLDVVNDTKGNNFLHLTDTLMLIIGSNNRCYRYIMTEKAIKKFEVAGDMLTMHFGDSTNKTVNFKKETTDIPPREIEVLEGAPQVPAYQDNPYFFSPPKPKVVASNVRARSNVVNIPNRATVQSQPRKKSAPLPKKKKKQGAKKRAKKNNMQPIYPLRPNLSLLSSLPAPPPPPPPPLLYFSRKKVAKKDDNFDTGMNQPPLPPLPPHFRPVKGNYPPKHWFGTVGSGRNRRAIFSNNNSSLSSQSSSSSDEEDGKKTMPSSRLMPPMFPFYFLSRSNSQSSQSSEEKPSASVEREGVSQQRITELTQEVRKMMGSSNSYPEFSQKIKEKMKGLRPEEKVEVKKLIISMRKKKSREFKSATSQQVSQQQQVRPKKSREAKKKVYRRIPPQLTEEQQRRLILLAQKKCKMMQQKQLQQQGPSNKASVAFPIIRLQAQKQAVKNIQPRPPLNQSQQPHLLAGQKNKSMSNKKILGASQKKKETQFDSLRKFTNIKIHNEKEQKNDHRTGRKRKRDKDDNKGKKKKKRKRDIEN